MRRRRERGQAAIELAFLLPVVIGLLALTIQGGLVISDQVQLQHFAYEGAQWAVAHPSVATVDSGTPGTVTNHVLAQMCAGGVSVPTANPLSTRFCLGEPPGITNLQVSVTRRQTPTALDFPILVTNAEAAACKSWALARTPTSRIINPGDTTTYSVSLVTVGATGSDTNITLTGGNYPAGTSSSSQSIATFNPPTLNTAAVGSSLFTLSTPSDAKPGVYNLFVSGVDGCGVSHAVYTSLVVNPPLPGPPPVTPVPSIDSVKASVLPILVCVGASIDITGHNFQPGAKVYVGPDLATSVVPIGTDELVAFFSNFSVSGVQPTWVVNSNGTSANFVNSVTISPCAGLPVIPPPCNSNCPPPGPGPNPPIPTWPTCVSNCALPGCTTTCTTPVATEQVKMADCTANCVAPACQNRCGEPNCTSFCNESTCTNYCDMSKCTNNCFGPTSSCIANCGPSQCVGNCSNSGQPASAACAGGSGSYEVVVTITWNEPLIIPVLSGSSPPWVTLTATQLALCQ